MTFLKMPGSWNNAVAGFVLLAVVVFDVLIRRTVRNRRPAARAVEMRRSELEQDGGGASVRAQTPEAMS